MPRCKFLAKNILKWNLRRSNFSMSKETMLEDLYAVKTVLPLYRICYSKEDILTPPSNMYISIKSSSVIRSQANNKHAHRRHTSIHNIMYKSLTAYLLNVSDHLWFLRNTNYSTTHTKANNGDICRADRCWLRIHLLFMVPFINS